jgi:4-hydroxy-4-methyl-2-oxoglutarate aldolase
LNTSIVYTRVERVASALCEQARQVTVSDAHEAMGVLARSALMTPRMRPLNRGLRIAGPAVTAFCAPGDNLMMHRALYLAQPGDVLVVVSHSEDSGAQWGDVAAQYAAHKGLAGVIVQGCIRDTDVLEQMRFPVWSTRISPARPGKSGHGMVNTPVSCGGVIVHPGDLIIADGDGVLAIPRADADWVLQGAVRRMQREEEAGKAIRAGAHPWDFSGAAANYAAMEITEIDDVYREGGAARS